MKYCGSYDNNDKFGQQGCEYQVKKVTFHHLYIDIFNLDREEIQ